MGASAGAIHNDRGPSYTTTDVFLVNSQRERLLPAWAFEEEDGSNSCASSGSGSGGGSGGTRASAASSSSSASASAAAAAAAAMAAAAAQAYLLIFAAAFLSSLLGFNTGVSLAVQGRLRHPDSDVLGRHRAGPSIAAQQQEAAIAAAALEAARADLAATDGGDQCRTEANAEYAGEFVVKWGEEHLKDTAAECCASCGNYPRCNVWVWCADPGGCGDGRKHRECWLKEQKGLVPAHILGARGPAVKWTSGARVAESDALERLAADHRRRLRLRADAALPLVYLDVGIKGKRAGRIEAVLFAREAPRAAENFRQLCTGEAGIAKPGHEGAGQPYHFKGRPFYRIIEGFIDQTGAEVDSVFGGAFRDDKGGLALKHDRAGLLSMANAGPNTNTAHFSILLGPAPHLDGSYTVFGEVVTGLPVVRAINALARGKPDRTATADDGAFIIDSGQLRRGQKITKAALEARR